ncbi:MAG TPA: hypothetical protein VKA85_07145 [Candidatus Limnocylindrales bacterium]|nr:hypothetical protein [Candidatus Limnocylindrales bacterium]
MNPGLAALALAVVAGGVIAVSAREARVAVTGLTVSGITAPLIADPFPGPLPLAARLVGSILAGYLLWVAVRHEPSTRGSRLGWPVEALGAAAAGVAGYGAAGFAGPATGPAEALGAAFALGYLALGPLVVGTDTLRLGVGLMLVVLAGSVARIALAGSPPELEQLVLAGLTVAVAGAAGAVAAAAVRRGGLAATSASLPEATEPEAAAEAGRRVAEGPESRRRAAAVEPPPALADQRPRRRSNPLGWRTARARKLLGRR